MAAKPVVVVDPHFRRMSDVFAPSDLARLERIAEVVWARDEPMSHERALRLLPRALALVMCYDWRYGDVLASAGHLRAILDVSGGFPQDLDYDQCFSRGIRVLTAAPAFGPQVAEMALGLALAASRGIVAGDRAMRSGHERWKRSGNEDTFLLYEKRVGFIGFGGIGRSLRPLIEPFGCSIAVYDPWLGDGYLRSLGVEPLPLDELLATSRVIFVLAAPTTENEALLSRDQLECIQPDAMLVLVSRAHVVDFDALTELVLAGRFKAAIDVFPMEPLPLDHPIRGAPGAVLSAHRAGSVEEGHRQIGRFVVDDLEALVQGHPPQRMQQAQPELASLYASLRIAKPRV